eukprot:GILI01012582.1.p1 GENE.GILI01012582.1~~GILI01012582.1.p1  ORF type:complete len:1239 (-),score=143.30 GILI01012582.1:82-3612(-)
MPENEEDANAGKESTVKEEESYCSMVPLPPTQVGSSSANESKCSLRTQLRYDLLCVKALGLTPLDADGLLPLLLTPQISQSASSTKVSRSLITGLTWSIDRVLNECVVEATISLPSSFLGTNMSTRADDASIEVNQLSRGTLAPSPMRPESRNQTPLLFGNNKERLGRFLSNSPSVSADESVLRGGHTEQQLLLPRLMALVQQRRVEESDDNIRNDLAPSNLSMALAVAYLDAVTPKLLSDRALSGCAIWLPSLIGKTILEGPTRIKQDPPSFVPATQHPTHSVADIGGRSLFVPATQEGPCPPSMPQTTIDDPSSDVLLKGTVPSTYGPHSSLFPLPLGTQLPNVNTVPTNIPSAFPQFAERLRFVLQLAGANTIMGNHCEMIAEFGDALRDEISLVVGHDLVGAKRRKVFVVDTVSLLEGFLLTTIPTRVPSQSTHPKDKKSGGERKVGSQHQLHADFDRFLEGLNLKDGESTTSRSQLVQQRVIQWVATNVSSLTAQPLVSLSPSSVLLGPSANPPPAAAKINSEHFLIKCASDLVVQQQRITNSTDRQPSARPISFKIIGVDWLVHRLLSGPPSAEADLTTPPQCLLQAFEEAQLRDVDAQPPLSEAIETRGIADDNANEIETPSAADKCIEEPLSVSGRRKSQQNSQQSVRSNFSLSQTSVAGSASSGHAMRKKSAAREALAPLIVPQSLPSSSSATEEKSSFREQQHTHQTQEEELTVGLAQDLLDIHPGQSESSMGSALLPAHRPPEAAEQRSLMRQETSSILLPDPSPEYVTKDSVTVLATRLAYADEEQRVDPIPLNNQEGLGLNKDIDQPVAHMFTHPSVEVPFGDSARSVIVSIGDDFYAAQPADDVGSGSEDEGDEVVLGRVELIEEELLLGAPEGRALTDTIDVEDNKSVVLSRSFWVTLRLYDITTVFVSKRSSNRTRGSAATIPGNDVSPSSKRQREEVDGREAPRKVLVGEEAFITPHGNHQPRLLVPSSASPVVSTPSVSIRRRPKVSLSAYRTTRVPIEALDVTTPVFILEEHLLQHVYVLSSPHPTSASPTAEAHVVSNQLHLLEPNMPSSAASGQVDDTNTAPALQRLESFQSSRMTGRAVLYSAGTSPIGRHAFRPLSSDSVTNTYGDPPTVATPGGVPTVQQHSAPSLFGVGGVTPNRYVTPSSYITRLPGTPY